MRGEHRKRVLVLFQEGPDEAGIFVNAQAEELNARTILELFVELLEARQLLAANPSPSGPEIQQHHLAAEIAEFPCLTLKVRNLKAGQRVVRRLPRKVRLREFRRRTLAVP